MSAMIRVSFKTTFDSKQLKLVLALSKTKCLFRLFWFYTETESFGVSIEPKQTEEQPKQCDREHILEFFQKILGCFGWFRILVVSVLYRTESFNVLIEPKQREDQPKQFDRCIFWYF
jgi:hypothetical protein